MSSCENTLFCLATIFGRLKHLLVARDCTVWLTWLTSKRVVILWKFSELVSLKGGEKKRPVVSFLLPTIEVTGSLFILCTAQQKFTLSYE